MLLDVPDREVPVDQRESNAGRLAGLEHRSLDEALELLGRLFACGRKAKIQLRNVCTGELARIGDVDRDLGSAGAEVGVVKTREGEAMPCRSGTR